MNKLIWLNKKQRKLSLSAIFFACMPFWYAPFRKYGLTILSNFATGAVWLGFIAFETMITVFSTEKRYIFAIRKRVINFWSLLNSILKRRPFLSIQISGHCCLLFFAGKQLQAYFCFTIFILWIIRDACSQHTGILKYDEYLVTYIDPISETHSCTVYRAKF